MERERMYLTATEKEMLEEKLKYLSTVKRKEVAEKLREATSEKSDVEDNVAFEVAKTEQGFLEGRIREIEGLLSLPILSEEGSFNGIVRVGSAVTIEEHLGHPETFTIVGTTQADPRRGKISYRSPLGKALMGRAAGDEIVVSTPSGERNLFVIMVE